MRKLLFGLFLFSGCLYAQETQGIKPGISIYGSPCLIQNLVYSCVPRTCDSIVIVAGDSIDFCTYQAIELNVDTAYWLRWQFTGCTNLADTILHTYPTQTPLCHVPRWDTAGIFMVEVFYNGDLTAYPTCDCYQQGPSHWFIKVVVLPNPNGVEEPKTSEITIAPNPSSGKFTLLNGEDTSQVTICDISGRVLFQTNEKEFDLSPYGSGMYFANVSFEGEVHIYSLLVN